MGKAKTAVEEVLDQKTMAWIQRLSLLLIVSGVLGQSDEELTQEQKLCRGKSAGEFFRLKSGKDSCRDVIQCTAGVSKDFYESALIKPFSRARKPSNAPLVWCLTWRRRRVIGS